MPLLKTARRKMGDATMMVPVKNRMGDHVINADNAAESVNTKLKV
jgi:hypothetical protein